MKNCFLVLLLMVDFAVSLPKSYAQNIGIGTSTPSSRLHIIGNEVSVPLRIQNTLNSGYAGLHFHGLTGELMGHLGYANPATAFQPNTFYVGSIGNVPVIYTTAGVERMRIAATGEVGIGTLLPNTKAILDISSNSKGLLIPRLTTLQRNAIVSPPTGLIVYDSTGHVIYYHNGNSWQSMASSANTWGLTGNSSTNPSVNFLGTTDNNPLRLRVNNIQAGFIDHINKNVLVGSKAGLNLPGSAFGNTIIGDSAFANANSAISSNTVIGYGAQAQTTSDVFANTVIGADAGRNNTGHWNTFIGEEAGMNNQSFGSVFIGSKSGMSNTTGGANTFLGDNSGNGNRVGSFNTYTGTYTGYFNKGSNNTFMGYSAGYFGDSTFNNSFVGSNSGYNTKGSGNTALGASTLQNNTTGYSNVAIGTQALRNNTTRSNLVAIGDSALYNNISTAIATDGINNTAVGSKSLYANTIGAGNTALGFNSLKANISGYNNVAIGSDALLANNFGVYNTATGFRTLYATTDANYNSAYGSWTLYNNTGSNNTAFGYSSLYSNIAGNNNTAVGANANVTVGGLTNATALGANATVNASNKIRLGSSAVTVIEGQVGYTFPSDGRFKENIKEDVIGLDFILKLKPVSYQFNRLRYSEHIKEKISTETVTLLAEQSKNRNVGFIAQDVEKIMYQTGFTSFNAVHAPTHASGNYSMGYAEFVVPLVKAIQEQQLMIDSLQKRLETGKPENPMYIEKQQQQIEELRKEIDLLKEQNKLLWQVINKKN